MTFGQALQDALAAVLLVLGLGLACGIALTLVVLVDLLRAVRASMDAFQEGFRGPRILSAPVSPRQRGRHEDVFRGGTVHIPDLPLTADEERHKAMLDAHVRGEEVEPPSLGA